MGSFSVSGSCQADTRGTFRASLIRDEEGRKQYYPCEDESLTHALYELHRFLMGKDVEAYVVGHKVKREVTRFQKRHKVEMTLGIVRIQLLTTQKPGVSWLIMDLPFSKVQSNEAIDDEEGSY